MSIGRGAAEGPPQEDIRRQAIVLVHGMGEQVPMETVRDFATAVWASDRDLHSGEARKSGQLFSVPDSTSGSRELRRISTRKSRPRQDAGDGEAYSVRNDFFELYWADSTADTRWSDFLAWYWRLVIRWPWDAPKAVRWIWGLLWATNIACLLAAEIAALWLVTTEVDTCFSVARFNAGEALTPFDWLATYGQAFQTPTAAMTWKLACGWGVVACLGYLVREFSPYKMAGGWMLVSGLLALLWSLLVLAGLMLKPPIFIASQQHNVLGPGAVMLGGAVVLVVQGFLIKFFGDVARYTLASPGNVVPRQKVRDRGIALINQLTATGQYDRIVLVAHSLGCLIAYDILGLLWADYVSARSMSGRYPDGDSVASAVEDLVHAAKPDGRVDAARMKNRPLPEQPESHFDLGRFRKAQRALFRALKKADAERLGPLTPGAGNASGRWLISDLITIANPLTHAEFLLAPRKKQLDARFSWRELSLCPPRLERLDGRWSFLYRPDGGGPPRFNHDSVFAAVRWTSIHDAPKNPRRFLTGDFISGPAARIFGRGVVDVKVEPRRSGATLPERMFTHTIYWEMKQARGGRLPHSVRVIRNALNLLDESDREEELLSDAAPPRPHVGRKPA